MADAGNIGKFLSSIALPNAITQGALSAKRDEQRLQQLTQRIQSGAPHEGGRDRSPQAANGTVLQRNLLRDSTLKGSAQSDKQLNEAATQFESLLVNEMLKSMWSSVPSGGLLSGSHEEELYRDMLNQTVSESIAKQQSLGIRDIVAGEMKNSAKKTK